jgi:hypothetical protein
MTNSSEAETLTIYEAIKETRSAVWTIVVSECFAKRIAVWGRFLQRAVCGRLLESCPRDHPVDRPGAIAVWVAITIIALSPLIGGGAAWLAGNGPSGAAWGWIATYSVLTLWLFASARWTFKRLLAVGPAVDQMFFHRDEAEPVASWLELQKRWWWRRAFWLLLAGVIVAVGVISAIRVDHHHLVNGAPQLPEAGTAWFAAIGLTLFWAVDTVSWLVRIPLLVRRLQGAVRLRVIIHAPVTTQGIRELSKFLTFVAMLSAVGLFLFAVPVVWSVLLGLHHAGSQIGHRYPRPWNLVWLSALPLALTLGLNIYVTFISQWWLSQVVEKQRDRLLDEVAAALPDRDPPLLMDDDYQRRRALYDLIAGASTQTVEGRAIFHRAALIVASVTPYLSLLAKRLFP